ncbi:hypothetical protein QBC40DRAFT_255199 [Triangularia verruculosa]|uniref:Uncharacterized protein n=1 Tax=Triangularia verruculosa TaxID=2587418 RepID=A0AAN6XIQ8_9PEZI|nr:hypothetical protein QBC40DRAFT_255199 [Triangularia verruculosa]
MNGYHHDYGQKNTNHYHHRPPLPSGGFGRRAGVTADGVGLIPTHGLPPLQPGPRPPRPPPHHPLHVSSSILSPVTPPETRTLMTFPTPGLPSPRVVPVSQVVRGAAAVRYPPSSVKYNNSNPHNHAHIIANLQATSNLRNLSFLHTPAPPVTRRPTNPNDTSHLPTQIQTNRWLCCQCAGEGFIDPVGTVHLDLPLPPPPIPAGTIATETEEGETALAMMAALRKREEMYSTCLFRPSDCRHKKCPNCVLYAGPASSRDPIKGMKFLVRTVGGLYTSGRFVDPVRWECHLCGEWEGNRIDGAVRLNQARCKGQGCAQQRREHERGWGGWLPLQQPGGRGVGPGVGGGGGILTGESVVMNRYGQRLGTSDQRVAFEGGPWDWHRRGLGDGRCVLSRGVREVLMRRPGENHGTGEGRKVWKQGEPVPDFGYRRPPPLDENDERENSEYEGGFLAGLPVESGGGDKGKGKEREVGMEGVVNNNGDYGRQRGGFASTISPATRSTDTGQAQGVRSRLFPGLSHMRM